MDCVFCDVVKERTRVLFETRHLVAILDAYPITAGHALVIPKRHVDNVFGLTSAELGNFPAILKKLKAFLDERYSPDGYNVGTNVGGFAGQAVFHCHFHVVPRHKGDAFGGFRKISGMIFRLPEED